MFLNEWLHHWLKTYVLGKVKGSTYTTYKNSIDNHVIPAIGNIPLHKLTVDRLQKFFNDKSATGRLDGKDGGLSAKTLNNIKVTLNEVLSRAIVDGKMISNPLTGVKLKKVVKKEMRVLTKEEQAAIERIVDASTPFKVTSLGLP